jgi:hypothetical protein
VTSLRRFICSGWDRFRGAFGREQPPRPAKEDAIDEFFKCGSQYYVAGRYGMFASLIPVAANLHHHAIEMLLKGALSKSMSLEKLKRNLGHRLPKIWRRFKRQANDASLNRFDNVIKELNKFEDIRYPDKILRSGANMMFDITKVWASQSYVKGTNEPQYKLCLEDIDELVTAIFKIASRNQKIYLGFMKEEARQFVTRENHHFHP